MPSIAMVGAGKWGFNWVRTLARLPNVQFKYCCDLSTERLKTIQQQFPGVGITTRFEDLLEDKTLDGIVLATIAPTHFHLARKALLAGKHLMVEKPLTLCANEAQQLVDLAAERQRVLMVGHLLEYHPAILFIKKMINQGELGDLYYLYSQRLNLGTIRKDENAWWSLAPHDISVACRLFEEDPVAVQCRGQNVIQPDVADVVFGTLTFASGRIAHIHVSWLDPHKTRKLTVVGSKRMVSFDDTLPNYQITVHDKSVSVQNQFESYADWISMRQGDIVQPQVPAGEPLLQEAKHFVECIETGKTPRSDGKAGQRVVAVLEQGDRSLKQNGALMEIKPPGGCKKKVA